VIVSRAFRVIKTLLALFWPLICGTVAPFFPAFSTQAWTPAIGLAGAAPGGGDLDRVIVD
jgi:hypothetical protein